MSRELDRTMKKMASPIWDCRQARAEIALEAGGDAGDAVARQLLAAHLTDCDGCRGYRVRMRASLDALQTSAVQADPVMLQRSLWPGVAARLPVSIRPSAASRFNVWVPTAAMAAACAAMVFVTIVQVDRVIPLEPMLTPHWRSALSSPEPNRLPRVSADRLRFVQDAAAVPGAVPVKFELAPRPEPPLRDRDW